MSRIKFLFFDLGNVLLNFSHNRMVAQIAEASGVCKEHVRRIVFESRLQLEYECGAVDSAEFCRRFRLESGAFVTDAELMLAAGQIFWLNREIVPLIGSLLAARIPMGILSNTCDAHWNYIKEQKYNVVEMVPRRLLSFQLGAAKPARGIYELAMQLVGAAAEEVFFVDDLQENVDGAIACGMDAVVFTTVTQLARQLHARDVEFNF